MAVLAIICSSNCFNETWWSNQYFIDYTTIGWDKVCLRAAPSGIELCTDLMLKTSCIIIIINFFFFKHTLFSVDVFTYITYTINVSFPHTWWRDSFSNLRKSHVQELIILCIIIILLKLQFLFFCLRNTRFHWKTCFANFVLETSLAKFSSGIPPLARMKWRHLYLWNTVLKNP